MNRFFDYFDRYSPRAWFKQGLIESNEKFGAAQVQSKARPLKQQAAIIFASAFIAAAGLSNIPSSPTTVQTTLLMSVANLGSHKAGMSPDDISGKYWLATIATLNSMRVIQENEFDDIESIF